MHVRYKECKNILIIIPILEDGKKQLEDMTLDELDLIEDEEDERVLLEYR